MLEAFIIVLREGFEAFLIVAIIFAYLRKTSQRHLLPAVYLAIATAIATSIWLAVLLKQGANQSLWEGIFGLIAIVLVGTLLVHMRRVAPRFSAKMHNRLDSVSSGKPRWIAFPAIFFFSVLMITREGMETALMLTQVHGSYLQGAILGLIGATLLALLWARYGHLINMKRFFQVTTTFLVIFMFQIALYTFHEFSEVGLFGANSDAIHAATEIWSPDGLYGRWIPLGAVAICALWLIMSSLADRARRIPTPVSSALHE
jgi:high-affinity iron transporter